MSIEAPKRENLVKIAFFCLKGTTLYTDEIEIMAWKRVLWVHSGTLI